MRFQLGERDYSIEEVLDQWYGPEDAFFKVRADDGNEYIASRFGKRRMEFGIFRRLQRP